MSARQRRECNKEGPADHPMGKRPACFVIGLGPDRKDQIVFSQGEVADAIFYIQQGKVKLIVVSEQGKEAVVAILGPGQFFGEACLNGNPLRIATTRALEECVITRLEKATMIATIH